MSKQPKPQPIKVRRIRVKRPTPAELALKQAIAAEMATPEYRRSHTATIAEAINVYPC